MEFYSGPIDSNYLPAFAGSTACSKKDSIGSLDHNYTDPHSPYALSQILYNHRMFMI